MSDTMFRLLQIHQRLDQKLRAELTRRWPDVLEVAKLKKLKLAVKDKLYQRALRQSLTTA